MAAAVAPHFADPKLFEGPFVGVSESTQTTERPSYGTLTDIRELTDFFRGYEADVRFKSTFSAMLAAEAGVALGSGPPAGWDPYVDRIDRISKGTAVHHRLSRMSHEHVRVLVRLYGPRNATHERPEFADLAPIIEMTCAVTEARDELVFDESTVRSERVAPRVRVALAERHAEFEAMFWTEAGLVMKAEASLARIATSIAKAKERVQQLTELIESTSGKPQEKAIARLVDARADLRDVESAPKNSQRRKTDLSKRVAAGRQLMKQLIDGINYDGALRAELGAITGTDRELTAEDAISAVVDAPKRIKNDHEAHVAWRARRKAFLATAVEQATIMRRAALAAYRLAKQADPPAPPSSDYVRTEIDYTPSFITHSVSGASP